METVDLIKLRNAHRILVAVVDRLVELDDQAPDSEGKPRSHAVEIDGVTPHQNYCRNCECCEGMDW